MTGQQTKVSSHYLPGLKSLPVSNIDSLFYINLCLAVLQLLSTDNGKSFPLNGCKMRAYSMFICGFFNYTQILYTFDFFQHRI